jgi:hypothetical protein
MIHRSNRAYGRNALRRGALVALALCLGGAYLPSAHAQTTVFDFTGNCTDCSGVGTGVLTLQNYTPGAAIDPSNFVSFVYSSNLTTVSISDDTELSYTLAPTATSGAMSFAGSSTEPGTQYVLTTSGSLDPSLLPGPANFSLEASLGTTTSSGFSLNEILFDTCGSDCQTGTWTLSVVAQATSQQPGGGAGEIKDTGASHTWSVPGAAPEIDAATAAGGLTLLLGSLVVLNGRRRSGYAPRR